MGGKPIRSHCGCGTLRRPPGAPGLRHEPGRAAPRPAHRRAAPLDRRIRARRIPLRPVIREERTGIDTVTWGEFVEAGYLREYRAKQVTLQYLRPVIAILREELGVRYPLATLKPYTSGRSLALKVQKQVGLDPSLNIVVLGRDGSLHLTDPAAAFLEKVDFAEDGTRAARRLYPLGRSVPVVLDPDHGFGEPTLPSGVRTEAVAELVAAGEQRDRVAAIYNISLDDVNAALRFENDRAA